MKSIDRENHWNLLKPTRSLRVWNLRVQPVQRSMSFSGRNNGFLQLKVPCFRMKIIIFNSRTPHLCWKILIFLWVFLIFLWFSACFHGFPMVFDGFPMVFPMFFRLFFRLFHHGRCPQSAPWRRRRCRAPWPARSRRCRRAPRACRSLASQLESRWVNMMTWCLLGIRMGLEWNYNDMVFVHRIMMI